MSPLFHSLSLWVWWVLTDLRVRVDFTKKNGTGGESIYGGTFEDENFDLPLDAEGYEFSRLCAHFISES